ncbi:MAG: hypothetical protein DRR03_05210 [Gammaproteobacteria bacterium]|nr:MAG: hypothetical protein DRR03_05210 [Gammaproteobacteria bacterium]
MKTMGLKTLATAAIISVTLALGGCGGGGAKTEVRAETTTTGQQLLDLKKAYEAGALTEKEYESEREKILDRE